MSKNPLTELQSKYQVLQDAYDDLVANPEVIKQMLRVEKSEKIGAVLFGALEALCNASMNGANLERFHDKEIDAIWKTAFQARLHYIHFQKTRKEPVE